MKKIIRLLLLSLFCLSTSAFAQQKAKAKISSVKQNSTTIEFTVNSNKPFYMGDNIHVLHIGNKNFSISKQLKEDGEGYITFYIPLEDFNKLSEGDGMYITYGEQTRAGDTQQEDLEELSKHSKTAWALGKFSKQLLTK